LYFYILFNDCRTIYSLGFIYPSFAFAKLLNAQIVGIIKIQPPQVYFSQEFKGVCRPTFLYAPPGQILPHEFGPIIAIQALLGTGSRYSERLTRASLARLTHIFLILCFNEGIYPKPAKTFSTASLLQ
jgi:hypothetical protein